jgi:hypothetical protein
LSWTASEQDERIIDARRLGGPGDHDAELDLAGLGLLSILRDSDGSAANVAGESPNCTRRESSRRLRRSRCRNDGRHERDDE